MEETWELAALVMATRPAIPAAVKEAVKREAGYRCAVPRCRDKGPFDFEHIDDWVKVQKHEFHNIVLLCVSCHAKVTRTKEISKASIRSYKRNLAIISGRYSLFEMRLLELYKNSNSIIKDGKVHLDEKAYLFITERDRLHLMGLEKDKFIRFLEVANKTLSPAAIEKIVKSEKFQSTGLAKVLKTMGLDHVKQLINNVNQNVGGRASYIVSPTIAGLEFVEKYFNGEEIE